MYWGISDARTGCGFHPLLGSLGICLDLSAHYNEVDVSVGFAFISIVISYPIGSLTYTAITGCIQVTCLA